jgi:hypothetical protein
VPPVEVTRFFTAAPAPAGTIAVEDANNALAQSMEYRSYAAAVGQELQRLGFSEVQESGKGQYVALVALRTNLRSPVTGGSAPVSVGVGGATGSYGSGVGVGIGINLGPRPKPVSVITLGVQIRRRADNIAVWEGRARTEVRAGTPAAQPGLAAAKLAAALFQGYPGQSGQTITVK